jgi:hypothetical protein
MEGLNIGLLGVCEGEMRRVTIPPAFGFMNFTKGPPIRSARPLDPNAVYDFYLSIQNVTSAGEYRIFEAIKQRNISEVLDMIEQKVGINAIDEVRLADGVGVPAKPLPSLNVTRHAVSSVGPNAPDAGGARIIGPPGGHPP